MNYRKAALIPTLLLACTSLQAAANDDIKQFSSGDRLEIDAGETYTGDLYFAGRSVVIDGTLEGDLIAVVSEARINGTVTGDVVVWASQLEIDGAVDDSVRFFGANLWHRGRIDGDLLAFAAQTRLGRDSTVTANVLTCGGMMEIDGTIDGDLKLVGGQAELNGSIGGDTEAELDVLKLRSGAQLAGNLSHTTREFESADDAVVLGETIEHEKKARSKSKKSGGISAFSVGFWFWSTLAAILLGLVLVALFRRAAPAVSATIQSEGMMGLLIGFGAFLVVPAACLIAILLLISAPIGVLGLVVYMVALYLAKMPVALWLGERALKLVGQSSPSPYLAIIIGLIALKLLFTIPYLGGLLTLAVICLGLGTMILATRNHMQRGVTAGESA
jgi:cytoskeletal protein CcmA (bactofilin family)